MTIKARHASIRNPNSSNNPSNKRSNRIAVAETTVNYFKKLIQLGVLNISTVFDQHHPASLAPLWLRLTKEEKQEISDLIFQDIVIPYYLRNEEYQEGAWEEKHAEPKENDDDLITQFDINKRDPKGNTIIHWAISLAQVDLALKLADTGALLRTVTNRGSCVLLYAMSHPHLHKQLFMPLLERGARLDRLTEDQKNLLHGAAINNNVSATRLLLERGFDILQHNQNGLSPIQFAAALGHHKVLRIMLEARGYFGEDHEPIPNEEIQRLIFQAINSDNKETLEIALSLPEVDANIPLVTSNLYFDTTTQFHVGRVISPLQCAAAQGKVDAMALLLARNGGTIPEMVEDSTLTKPLIHHTILSGNLNAVKFALAHSETFGNVNTRTVLGISPLHFAANLGESAILQELLNQDNIIFFKNGGMTLLHYAARSGNPKTKATSR